MSSYWKCIAAAASQLDIALIHHITDYAIDHDTLEKTGQGILTTIFTSVLALDKTPSARIHFLADLIRCLEDSGFRPFEVKHAWLWIAWDFYPPIKAAKDFLDNEINKQNIFLVGAVEKFDDVLDSACTSETLSGLGCAMAFRLPSIHLFGEDFVRKVLKSVVKHGVPDYCTNVDPAKQVHYDRVNGDVAQKLFGPLMHCKSKNERVRALDFFARVLGDKYRDQFLTLVDSTGEFPVWVDLNATDSFNRKKRQAKELLEKKDRAKRRKEEIEEEIERLMDEAEEIEAEFFINDDEEEEESDCESSSSEVF